MSEQSIDTKCQWTDKSYQDQYGAISFPIYQTATFSHSRVGDTAGFQYTRHTNPTRAQLQSIVAKLENGTAAYAFASGMAAINAVLELFAPGDHIIIDSDLYGGSVRLFNEIGKKNGITFTSVNLSAEDVEPYIQENTKAVYLETPTNPMMNVTDLEALAKVTKAHNALLIVDNTFLSPYFQNPLDLGADIVVHSGTKYIAGHHDTIAGFVVVKDQELGDRVEFVLKTTGAGIAPFDAWLIIRGIRTLSVRMDRAQENAFAIANFLKTCPYVKKVIYPGLEEHPGHEIMKKQARGFGSMISFEVVDKAFAYSVLENVELFAFAESLGGTETLITYPITQTHSDVPADVLAANGITDSLLRLSVGIEGAQDLIAEFERVFSIASKSPRCS